MKAQLLSALLVATILAGCADSEGPQSAAGEFQLAIVDDAPGAVDIQFAGAWVQQAGNGSWVRVVDQDATMSLDGTGDANLTKKVPAGVYERVRIVVRNVTSTDNAILTETGFELPMNLTVLKGQTTRLELTFSWTDTLFQSAEGLAFSPVLNRVALLVGGELILELTSKEIETASTKSPVARIEAFDSVGLRFFQSDFIADSPKKRMVASGPNLTLTATASEAVQAGATLSTYAWDFGDGTTEEGPSVDHSYPLSGGNFTIRLTVTDSFGISDSQTIKVALKPGALSVGFPFSGTLTGAYPNACATQDRGTGADSKTIAIDSTMTPDGTPADLVGVRVNVWVDGNPHAGADIDIRVLNPGGTAIGTSTSSGTSEEVSRNYAAGSAPASGDWTVEVKPCLALDLDYAGKFLATWLAQEPEPGYQAWLAGYDDGHDHSH